MNRWMLVVAVVCTAAACDRKPAVPADGTVATDSMSARDSVTDSTAMDSAAMTKAPAATKVEQAPIIGHDSAFGPIGSIDSTGKLIPNKPSRP
jgi:hypothetical protein